MMRVLRAGRRDYCQTYPRWGRGGKRSSKSRALEDGHRRVVDLQFLAASLTREPRPVGPKRGSGNPPACSERAEGSVKATCRARQRFQTKPRPSRFREAQKGGVLGSPSSSASFEFLFEALRLKGSARATPECARGSSRNIRLEGLRSTMLCTPIPHSLRSNSPIRTHDAINGMTLK